MTIDWFISDKEDESISGETYQEALLLIKTNTVLLTPETVPLTSAYGYVLAEEIVAPINIPGFHQSAMDGYAFCYEDYRQTGEFTWHRRGLGTAATLPGDGAIPQFPTTRPQLRHGRR